MPASGRELTLTAPLPGSKKVYVEQDGIRVPEREIALSGGEPSLRTYDTSGPGGPITPAGITKLRQPWIAARHARGDRQLTQMS